jgi:sugar phosphate isomerase/epimerase
MLKLGTYESWFDSEPIVPGDTLPEVLAHLESYGYQGIQIGARFMPLGWEEIGRLVGASPITLCVAGGGGSLLAADPEARRKGVEQVKAGLRLAARLGAVGTICVPVRQPEIAAPPPPATLYGLQEEILVEELREIAPVAEEAGAKLIIEPLNRYLSQFIQTLDQAGRVCSLVDSPAITFMADTFHMNIEEGDMGAAIERNAAHLRYVHLADSHRFQPGSGHLDFRPVLAALKRIGYDGWLTLECKILGEDRGRALTDTAALIRRIWDEV